MAITIKHAKTDTIADWTQADLDQQIAAGNYPPGTTLANIVLPSDWNNDHTVVGAAASGANSDITSLSGITGSITSPTYVGFNTSYATALGVGQLGWDNTNNALAYGMANGNIIQHIGEDQYLYVKASSAITKGQVCMFTGSVGASGVLTAAPATGITDGTYIMGVAAESIANNGFGFVQTFGVITGVNTTGFADGDILWYNPSVAGGLTNTKPSAPNVKVQVAACNKGGSAGGGVITVRINTGSTLGGTDSNAQITSPTNGQILTYDGTNTYWKNTSLTAGTGISITPSATGVITVTNTSPSSGGTVTSVSGTGTVSGISLSGTVTSSGSLTLGGTLNLSSPPTIGNTTPNTGAFTSVTTPSVTASSTDLTLSSISTGAVNLATAGGTQFQVVNTASATNYLATTGSNGGTPALYSAGASTNIGANIVSKGTGSVAFYTNGGVAQQVVSHTASAVNYVQVTGNVTGTGTNSAPIISAQGSDAAIGLSLTTKGGESIFLRTNGSLRTGFEIGHGGTTVNWLKVIGSATGNATPLFATGSDTNISMAFQPKGTGAIDLAAGSSGVNISNGGTVTAITRTAGGNADYTSFPTPVISAPTTAGGVQATATVLYMSAASATIQAGGTGYTLNDVVTLVGGTPQTVAATFTVSAVSGGVVTAVTPTNFQNYTALPTNPVSVTGGTGTGLTLNVKYSVGAGSVFSITNAGSGYIEQPTVSFSGGGGSGASAYATVGSSTTLKTIGANLSIVNPGGESFRVSDRVGSVVNFFNVIGHVSGSSPEMQAIGAGTNIDCNFVAKGTGSSRFFSGGTSYFEQLRVANTTSAVNYVQVTGAATGSFPVMSAQGSDATVGLNLYAKGAARINFFNNNGSNRHVSIAGNGTAAVNYLDLNGNIASNAPSIASAGTDTNIDLALTPKGTGNVVANAPVKLQGYTVATLPTAGTIGRTAYVTDALAPTYLGVLTGGGAIKTPVFDNGTAWVSY